MELSGFFRKLVRRISTEILSKVVGRRWSRQIVSYFLDPPRRYTSDWSSVSRRIREEARWRCGQCGVNCVTDQRLLHVHHINRDSLDNRPQNLIALCVQCHGRQPGSGHKAIMTASKRDGRWEKVNRLRNSGWWW
jgi:5-methylcytosine-specific restriction endonuclease McrA